MNCVMRNFKLSQITLHPSGVQLCTQCERHHAILNQQSSMHMRDGRQTLRHEIVATAFAVMWEQCPLAMQGAGKSTHTTQHDKRAHNNSMGLQLLLSCSFMQMLKHVTSVGKVRGTAGGSQLAYFI
jgi:hypothetical protein